MRFGLVVIGDEILSGRKHDQHLVRMIKQLSCRGLSLSWVEYIGDERSLIVQLFKRTLMSDDTVFSCGGIGATPDDHTRQAMAMALGVPLILHTQAKQLIGVRCAQMAAQGKGSADMTTRENLQRLKMGEFPQGSELIPNPINQVPGFYIRQHYFFPGFPEMALPMTDWVLDNHFAHLFHKRDWKELELRVFETAESLLTPLMEKIEHDFVPVKVYSLPSLGSPQVPPHIELGVKGPAVKVAQAYAALRSGVMSLGCDYAE